MFNVANHNIYIHVELELTFLNWPMSRLNRIHIEMEQWKISFEFSPLSQWINTWNHSLSILLLFILQHRSKTIRKITVHLLLFVIAILLFLNYEKRGWERTNRMNDRVWVQQNNYSVRLVWGFCSIVCSHVMAAFERQNILSLCYLLVINQSMISGK